MRFLPIRGDFNFPSKVAPAKSSETVFPSTGVNSGPLSMNLRFLLVILLVLVLDWVGCLRGRGRARGGLGSWSQCTVARPRGLSMNQPTPDPSQEGSRRSSTSSQFPSWGVRGGFRVSVHGIIGAEAFHKGDQGNGDRFIRR